VDIALINILQEHPDLAGERLRDEVNRISGKNLTTAAINARRGNLIKKQILKPAYVPDYWKIDKSMCGFIMIKTQKQEAEIANELSDAEKWPDIMEAHAIIGQYDILLKIRVRNMEELSRLSFRLREKFAKLERTETFIVSLTGKETPNIKL
jgi:DNA-binding Lrp family transcriptional regulator